MINERQKKTTKEYRDNYDRIFGKNEDVVVVDDVESKSRARRRAVQEGDRVAHQGEPCTDKVGKGDFVR